MRLLTERKTCTGRCSTWQSRQFGVSSSNSECVRVEWTKDANGRFQMKEIADSRFPLKADLVLLAMGFLGPRKRGLLEQAGAELDARGNIKANVIDYKSTAAKIFACGDMRRGQSLVVWAINEGRQAAHSIDKFLMGTTALPR